MDVIHQYIINTTDGEFIIIGLGSKMKEKRGFEFE